MPGNSRIVTSNQAGVHDNLEARVRRYQGTAFLRPSAEHSRRLFDRLHSAVTLSGKPLILDSGCGTGESTQRLARRHPDHLVIGIDKSPVRLKTAIADNDVADNVILARGDLTDLYPLMAQAGWQLDAHYLLYPNPWPKAAHLTRRWHAHPVFPDMLQLGGWVLLYTNWLIYAEEFARALRLYGLTPSVSQHFVNGSSASPFERKYAASQHGLWHVAATTKDIVETRKTANS